jgi:prepilin-type processing-associated H-X9-DG protein
VFIRHGQSAANVGYWDGSFAEIPLTELGWKQARALAARWDFVPGRIVISPFLRTRQTAEPTIERFPEVPVEIWPIQEFTYWDRDNWSGSAPEVMQDEVARFWRVADPTYRQGGGAESFGDLLGRARAALSRLERMEVEAPVLLFTHGHFMQALRHDLNFPDWSMQQKMATFYEVDERFKVKNTELMTLKFDDGKWRLASDEVLAGGALGV